MVKDIKAIVGAMIEGEYTSLILFGAYAKDEGYLKDGMPVNDLDLVLVDPTERQQEALAAITTSVPLDVLVIKSEEMEKLPPTQMWWEISKAHVVLAGKQPVFPKWAEWEIPYWDAIQSLDRRIVSMLIAKHEMMKERPNLGKIATQIFKLVIALGDAVLIKRGQFDHRYAVRSHMLMYDDIGDLYRLAVSHKILGWPEFDPDQLWKLWHQVQDTFANYITIQRVTTQYGDILLDVSERTTQEELAEIIKKLGAEKWL